MKGRAIPYSPAELAWLADNSTLSIRDYHAGFKAAFGRPDVAAMNLNSLRKRMGWATGRTGRFAKGQEPANKGKPCPPGRGGRHPNAQRTQFQKGARPHTYRGAGHERVDAKDGYVVMIVEEPNPWTGAKTRPVHKHRWLWEQVHGPIPKGFCLKCLDGDKTNTDPSNWELIPRGLLPLLNGGRHKTHLAYDNAAPEVRPVVMTLAKTRRAAGELRRKANG